MRAKCGVNADCTLVSAARRLVKMEASTFSCNNPTKVGSATSVTVAPLPAAAGNAKDVTGPGGGAALAPLTIGIIVGVTTVLCIGKLDVFVETLSVVVVRAHCLVGLGLGVGLGVGLRNAGSTSAAATPSPTMTMTPSASPLPEAFAQTALGSVQASRQWDSNRCTDSSAPSPHHIPRPRASYRRVRGSFSASRTLAPP